MSRGVDTTTIGTTITTLLLVVGAIRGAWLAVRKSRAAERAAHRDEIAAAIKAERDRAHTEALERRLKELGESVDE